MQSFSLFSQKQNSDLQLPGWRRKRVSMANSGLVSGSPGATVAHPPGRSPPGCWSIAHVCIPTPTDLPGDGVCAQIPFHFGQRAQQPQQCPHGPPKPLAAPLRWQDDGRAGKGRAAVPGAWPGKARHYWCHTCSLVPWHTRRCHWLCSHSPCLGRQGRIAWKKSRSLLPFPGLAPSSCQKQIKGSNASPELSPASPPWK